MTEISTFRIDSRTDGHAPLPPVPGDQAAGLPARMTHASTDTRDDDPPRPGLHDAVADVIGRGGEVVDRLGTAKTSVRFDVDGSEDASFVLLLDRRPAQIRPDGESAEITVHLDREQAEAYRTGALVLPIAVMRGEVEADGPLRKYLGVDPILRAALAAEARG